MNTFGLIIILGLAGLLAFGLATAMSACRDVTELLLDGTITDMRIDVEERQRSFTQPPCPDCPGSQPRRITEAYTVEHHHVTVAVVENGNSVEHTITVSPRVYADLTVGDAVQLRLLRSERDGRLCDRPKLVLEG